MKRLGKGISLLQLVRPIADQFVSVIEAHVDHESRLLANQWLAALRSARSEDSSQARRLRENASDVCARVMARERGIDGETTAAPAPDPIQVERTAELNRLRQILRPVSDTPTVPSPFVWPAAATSTDLVRSLEDEIRDAIAFLPSLPSDRCAAQIAVWAGKVQIHQAHPNDSRTRIAAGLLLKKLRGLAVAMDVGAIDALTPGYEWDWPRYVAMHEATAAGSGGNDTKMAAPEPAPDRVDEFSAVWK